MRYDRSIWVEIDRELERIGVFSNPVLMLRSRLDYFLKKNIGSYDKKVFIGTEYQPDEISARLIKSHLNKLGYKNVIVGKKILLSSFFKKVRYVINNRLRTDVILNIDYPYAKRKELLSIVRGIACHSKVVMVCKWLQKEIREPIANLTKLSLSLSYKDIYDDITEYNAAKDRDMQYRLALRLFGDFYFIKDFVHAEEWFKRICSYSDIENNAIWQLECIWHKIKENLDGLRKIIHNEDHFIVNWIDALRKEDYVYMPFVRSQADAGLFFERMYTPVPYTTGTLRSIFSGKLLIDDEIFRISNNIDSSDWFENSKLTRMVKKRGYELSFVSCHFKQPFFGDEELYSEFVWTKEGFPSTLVQFEALLRLAESEKKQFVIIHSLFETHYPCANPINCTYFDLHEYDSAVKKRAAVSQEIVSARYLDEQLRWYDSFYHNAKYKIYMSDHGKIRDEKGFCIEENYHVLFSVLFRDAELKRRINKTCSLLSFGDIVEICFDGAIKDIDHKICKDYVFIQMDDTYGNRDQIELYLNNGINLEGLLQCRGCVTTEDAYVKLACGWEYYYKGNDRINLIDDKRYADRISELRSIAGNLWIDIKKEQKYQGAQKIYELFGLEVVDGLIFLKPNANSNVRKVQRCKGYYE